MEHDLVARLERLPALVNGDSRLVARGRHVSLGFGLELGPLPYAITIDRGRIAALERGPFLLRSLTFLLRGGETAWRKFWEPVPEPHYHDIFALAKRGELRIEGELQPFMANLLYFKDVLAAPRRGSG
jgi:hypothetical protein